MTGISCNSDHQVISLSLYNIPTGTFDRLLCSLVSLTTLALVRVNLLGSIPAQISQLTNLQTLHASNNALTGALPPSLSLLVSLTSLKFDSNNFTGTVPQQLSTLVILRVIQLSSNRLTGTLPVALSSLISLTNFLAPLNLLTGKLPSQYSVLQQLAVMSLAANSMTGSIPQQLSSMRYLSLAVNNNPAMCGLPLSFGDQAGSNVGQNCSNPFDREFYLFKIPSSYIMTLGHLFLLTCHLIHDTR